MDEYHETNPPTELKTVVNGKAGSRKKKTRKTKASPERKAIQSFLRWHDKDSSQMGAYAHEKHWDKLDEKIDKMRASLKVTQFLD